MNKHNIFISGINGFIGKYLCNYLRAEYMVLPISRDYLSSIREKALLYSSLSPIPYAYIHLAGKAHDVQKQSKVEEYYAVNTALTQSVFDDFLKSEAQVFISLSSVKAVADSISDVLSEDLIPNPLTHYGKSKRLAEEYILANLPKDKRVYILRPCMVHGEGNKGNLNLLYNFVKKGIPYPLGAYDNKRSFLSVENLCFIIKELIERRDVPSGIYHLADDQPVATKDLIKLISDITNKRVLIWETPKIIINFIAKIGDFLPLPLNTERVRKMTENYVVSNQKIKGVLGRNLPVSAEDGLRKTIESFLK